MSAPITIDAFPPGDRRFVSANDMEIAVVNVDGEYYAFRNWCPHMGAPLGKGRVSTPDDVDCGSNVVSCPFHSWRFDLESGKSTFSELQIATFDVTRNGDELHLFLS